MDAEESPQHNPGPGRRRLTDAQRLDWLRLIRSENVGAVTFRELVNHYGGAGAALEALPELSRRGGGRRIRICPAEEAETELKRVARYGAMLVAPGEHGYPPWLAAVDAPPPLICIKGRPELMDNPVVAIVGARNGSAIGQKFARQLANDLGAEGFVIASGLARGI
ncbi:MAG: DNA-processing protein DprA, partial [Hyphomicrobiales bacterium]